VAIVKEGAKQVERAFTKPDDDWLPVLMFESTELEAPTIVGLPLEGFQDYASKDILAAGLRLLCEQVHAHRVAMVTSCWVGHRFGSREELPEDYRPSDDPQRTEAVVVTVIEPDTVEIHTAEIKRRKDFPPSLGEWEVLDFGVPAEGRFIDAIQPVLWAD
jgi:hypothetical protein